MSGRLADQSCLDGADGPTLATLERSFEAHRILRHPFLENLRQKRFTRRQIAIWVSQQFWFSRQFPRCLAALYARIDDWEASRPIVGMLGIEHWGAPRPDAHWAQFADVLPFFGLSLDGLARSAPLPETAQYLDTRLAMCLRATPEEALGVVAFAHELVNTQIFAAYLEGVRRLPEVPGPALAYFESHVRDESEDYAILRRIMQRLCVTPGSRRLLEKGGLEALEARCAFFDRIQERVQGAGA